ncbi:hypothetical protein H2200_005776 [Cladophialophora chaetospira]|uniref:Guanylate cyclase domain-containing protein n=1 Tax=Cladophialophora chaetospira TaxID=386627 RepID=A0AA39CIH3_9EURO|nr:hypothetical protein H2200_005776 [Cladophialophora chaetospira]
MPKLGLHVLRRVLTNLDSTLLSHNNGILLTIAPRRSPSHSRLHIAHENTRRRTLSSTPSYHQSKLNAINTKIIPPNSPYTTMVSNELPARELPAPTGHIGIVFTDIVKSTNIWEKDTNAMISAMKLHDDTIRSLTLSNSGYEVKQNGDGFMIAFPTATSAVQFCLDVQEKLLDEEWPKELLKLGPGKETTDSDGTVLFRGLQLRTSAHWGEPVTKWNEVIQRMDYLGPVVNRAARFVQVTEGGQIVVSEDFILQLQHEMQSQTPSEENEDPICTNNTDTDTDADTTNTSSSAPSSPPPSPDLNILRSKQLQDITTAQRFEIRELGDYEFQGLDHPQKLWFIVPRRLEGRVDHWHQVEHVSGVKGNVKP